MTDVMTKLCLLALVVACSAPDTVSPVSPATPQPAPAPEAVHAREREVTPEPMPSEPVDPALAETIRTAAAPYLKWTRVDEKPNIAPSLCRMPMGDDYGKASHIRMSDAVESPHDKKLYFLYASAKWDYLALAHEPRRIATGFTIVKESFHAVPKPVAPVKPQEPYTFMSEGPPAPVTFVETETGKRLYAGAASGLYVMTKIGPAHTPGTDVGWIYGTIAANGTVTSAGRVTSCMGCHENASHDRLFGLQPTKQLVESPAPPGRRGF
jgi:hypothetical protein